MNLDFSQKALDLIEELGFDYEPTRMTDREYVESLYRVLDDEDSRIAYKAAELERCGLYPQGMDHEEMERVGLLDEIYNKLAEPSRGSMNAAATPTKRNKFIANGDGEIGFGEPTGLR